MTGLTNYSADNVLNYITGQIAMPSLPAVYLALFTAVGTDAGTGFTEVSTSGTAYARVQVAGSLVTNAATATSSPTISASSVPAWVVAGMSVYDATNGNLIGTVLSTTGTTITLTANAAHAISSGDTLNISAFSNASGTGPASITNTAAIAFAAATGSGFGTVVAFGLYDAVTSGNLLLWDYVGGFNWMPATVSAASPGVITAHAHGISNGGYFVFSNEYGGTAPTFSAGNFTGILTAAGVSTDTLDVTGVNTSATGNGMIRQVTQQSIPTGVTASFAASTLTALAA
jgi:hypothetical protein